MYPWVPTPIKPVPYKSHLLQFLSLLFCFSKISQDKELTTPVVWDRPYNSIPRQTDRDCKLTKSSTRYVLSSSSQFSGINTHTQTKISHRNFRQNWNTIFLKTKQLHKLHGRLHTFRFCFMVISGLEIKGGFSPEKIQRSQTSRPLTIVGFFYLHEKILSFQGHISHPHNTLIIL